MALLRLRSPSVILFRSRHALTAEDQAWVILDHLDEARTFLNEARSVDAAHRRRVVGARDRYERSLRDLLASGVADGSFRADLDVKLAGIFILSILNALDRWYQEGGAVDRGALADEIDAFVAAAIT